MPFTLIHGFIGYLAIVPFTKNKKLRMLGFIGGLWPDIDAISLLFGNEAYFHYHRLMHPLIIGILSGLVAALLAGKMLKTDKAKSFAAFTAGFFLHSLFDVVFTEWPVKLLWPFSEQIYCLPLLMDYWFWLYIIATIAVIAVWFLEKEK